MAFSMPPIQRLVWGPLEKKLSGLLVPGWVSGDLVLNPMLMSDLGPVTACSGLLKAAGGGGRGVEGAQGGVAPGDRRHTTRQGHTGFTGDMQ